MGSDVLAFELIADSKISIHAPRMGSDGRLQHSYEP